MKEKLQQALSLFENATKKSANLFVVLKMDDLTDKWSVLLASEWITEENKRKYFDEFISILSKLLPDDEARTIARVGIWNSNDYLAKLLMDKYKTGDQITEDEQVNGNIIHEGYIFKVNK